MNDDPYDYYDYQMSGALDDKCTVALSDDKAKSFNLEYYLDGLRSIAGDDRGYGYVVDMAIKNAQKKHLEPKAFVNYVRKCGASNLIYNATWAGMNGTSIETMKGLAYSRICATDSVQRHDVSDSTAIDIVNRFCDNKEATKVFENATNGTQYPLEQSDETQVRKELNVPADDKNDDLEKSV